MNKAIKICLSSAITAYIIKFLVDLIMYIFYKNEIAYPYNDNILLFAPQIISSVFMIIFYCLFFEKGFYGIFVMISTIVLIITNVMFAVLLCFDRMIGFTYYFALVASINFLNSLYIKCNIIPLRKPGHIEYIPLLFELIPFVSMIISLYSIFCSFPTLNVSFNNREWEYYNLIGAIEYNIVSEGILIFSYMLCMLNNGEIIRDNMFEQI